MKLSLNTNANVSSQPSSTSTPAPESATKLRIKYSNSDSASVQPSPKPTPPKPKIKKEPTDATISKSKKRARDVGDDHDQGASAPKKLARKASLSISLPIKRQGSIKLPNPKQTPKTPGGGMRRLKINKKGKPLHRPLGVGYDSEAEDAEEDPALEENVILRMAPGPDSEYIRKAIEDRTMGLPPAQGGANVAMRFFRDSRRAAVIVQDRVYAAILVDLPCIVESMKGWDRRGWWKSADVCQMLLVTQLVPSEDAAQDAPLPAGLDSRTWQWPHGLTPPMYNVRKRRFRKRVSYRTIEETEDEVERLLALDEQAKSQDGFTTATTAYENEEEDLEEPPAEEYEDVDEEAAEYEDAGEEDGGVYGENGAPDEEGGQDAEAIAEQMVLELEGDETEEGLTGLTADEDPSRDIPDNIAAGEKNEPPQSVLNGSDIPNGQESDDEDDEDDEEEDEEEDAEDQDATEQTDKDREQAQEAAQMREEIEHLRREIEANKTQLSNTNNQIMRQRYQKRIESFEKDLANKKRALGVDEDEDEDAGGP